ncbi:MAG: type II glyceraldehyde-3-phosphate dehydrogenase [Bacteroidota bacterium]
MKKIKVAINGYGVIGKRIADAIAAQDDMELIGISDVVKDWRIKVAIAKKYPVYASTPESFAAMKSAGIEVAGTLDDLIKNADVVCDATPKKIAASNFDKYKQAGVRCIFQGGEKHALTGHSFVAQANYESAIGRDSTRVVSCNTTATVRILGALKRVDLLKHAYGVLVRRATDPWESDVSGIINTIVPESAIPSHQSSDAQTIIPDLSLTTIALTVPETISHFHSWQIELTRPVTKEEIIKIFTQTSRVVFLKASEGLSALNHTLELMNDLGRPRGDMWEVGIWLDSLTLNNTYLAFNVQVYNQAIVVPETIDAIRALTGIETVSATSIAKTDKALGILQGEVFKSFLNIENGN